MGQVGTMKKASRWSLRAAAIFAGAFGIATIVAAGGVLFGRTVGSGAASGVVPFVVWFNFCAGFVYIVAAFGLWLARRWSVTLALAIGFATAVVFIAYGLHVATGGSFQTRTVYALGLRTGIWVAIALLAALLLRRRPVA
jgi:hypothetical protein